MYFIEADAVAEIEYKISLLLNHQWAYFDWPPAVGTLTLMNFFHLNNRASKFSKIKIFQTWIDSWLNESDWCFSQKDNHKDFVSPLLESRSWSENEVPCLALWGKISIRKSQTLQRRTICNIFSLLLFFLFSPILSTSFHFLCPLYIFSFFCSVPVLWFSFSFSSYDLYLLFYFLLFSHFIRLPRKCKFSLLDFMTSRVSKIDIQNINVIMRHFPGP